MSTHLDASLQAALGAFSPLHFFAVEVLYPSFNLRLLDGPGQVTLNSNAFVGLDGIYGTLVLPESFSDGVAAEAPNISFGVMVPSNVAAAALCDPAAQGSPVNVYYSAVNRASGVPYNPYLIWSGELDVATWTVGQNVRQVKIDAESPFGAFNDSFDGALLTNTAHQSIWPGENGLQFVTDVQQLMPWGSDSPRPNVVRDIQQGQAPGQGVPLGMPVFAGGFANIRGVPFI